MSFSVDDPYELINVANSLNTGASESTIMLIMYISERFGRLGSTVNEFPGIPRDQFDSVVRDDFEPRLIEVGTDSTSTGESLIGMAAVLKQFHDQVPQVKSAAANLEQVLSQSNSPAEWKSAAAPLASALNNLYSVNIPSPPAANQSLEAAAQVKLKGATEDPAPSEADKKQGESQQQSGGSPSGAAQPAPSATPKQQTSSPSQSEPAAQDGGSSSGGGSGGGSPSGGGEQGGGAGSGSGASPTGAGASPAAGGSEAGKKGTNAAATLPSSSFDPLASTGLQSADLTPSSFGSGLGGGAGGGIGAGGLDPKSLGAAPGSAASLTAAGAPGGVGGPAGAARGMTSMMGGMMGPGMMGGRGGGGGEKEHKAPDYLYSEDNGYELIEKLPVVSPDVIGALTDDEIETMELQADFAFSDPA